MKKIIPALITFLIISITGCDLENSQKVRIKTNESNLSYKFKVHYPKSKTPEVVSYIEETLQEDIFANGNAEKDVDINIGKNNANFHLTAEPGFLALDFSKTNNDARAYAQLKKLCLGMKEVLNETK